MFVQLFDSDVEVVTKLIPGEKNTVINLQLILGYDKVLLYI